jgi:hypothetical protein
MEAVYCEWISARLIVARKPSNDLKTTYGVDVRIVQLEEGGLRQACFPALSDSIRKRQGGSESLS